MRGYTKLVVRDLLRQYLQVEQEFQSGHFDKCVTKLKQKHKDVADVLSYIVSHTQVHCKNQVVIALIVSV